MVHKAHHLQQHKRVVTRNHRFFMGLHFTYSYVRKKRLQIKNYVAFATISSISVRFHTHTRAKGNIYV